MVATNLKAETLALMDRRASLEAEMNSTIARLTAPGGPGISGSLLDPEAGTASDVSALGFPRPDIDIPAIRSDRRRLSELRNDHKDITNKIDRNLELLHSARLTKKDTLTNSVTSTSRQEAASTVSPTAMNEDPVVRVPFAMIDEIAEASPAAEDGLQLGDQIVKFGNVEIGDGLLPKLASEAQSNQGCPIPVVVMRQGAVMDLTVTPRPWHGRGLLGKKENDNELLVLT
ncbi:hypothetical protein QJS04_geneDACA003841 [Acorus gramineus]|uniref:Nas2 N-terminal domain-containing protein n=1 Tax=Acorus gramineus TaxID=55184 RepID=A0AAV9BHD7_ACOGR|nr:hypothetical protein QJS04_geneDACA003841 [Acorus gramineus]